jgi:hypothetical protein
MTSTLEITGHRDAYVIRVNIHNCEWDGTVCHNPVQFDDCRQGLDFKTNFCARDEPKCYFHALFATAPTLRLPKSQPPYTHVFDVQRPEPGDLAVFWGTFADGRNFPIGVWEVASFSDTHHPDFELCGRREGAVRFQSRTADWPTLDQRVRRSVGADMIRLLPASAVRTVLQRFEADHQAELERARQLGRNTDEARDVVSGLATIIGRLPEEHLQHAITFSEEDLEALGLVEDAPEPVITPLATEPLGQPRPRKYSFPPRLLADYRVGVEVSSLVVLAGPTGSGKTQLTKAYADDIGAEYELVSVRPDWRSNEDLLGYLPPFGDPYVATAFSHFVKRAADEWEDARNEERSAQAYHLCLDEMNLARPEYYLAEFLSKMELDGALRALQLYEGEERGFPTRLPLTPNLVVIGTVNNDDTTHSLSPKVLDRSVYLQIDSIDLEGWFARQAGVAAQFGPLLVEIDSILRGAGVRIGYRLAAQFVRWIEHAYVDQQPFEESVDAALTNLVLARVRVQRSEPGHQEMLGQLETFLSTQSTPDENRFPRSLEFVAGLRSRLERHEFVFGQFET